MYKALQASQKTYEDQKRESEKYNNQDQFAKYGKM